MRGQRDRQAYTGGERGRGKAEGAAPFLNISWAPNAKTLKPNLNLNPTTLSHGLKPKNAWQARFFDVSISNKFFAVSLSPSFSQSIPIPPLSVCVCWVLASFVCFFNFSTDCFITEYRARFEVGVGVRYFNWKSTVHADSWLTPRVVNSHQTECVSGKYLLGDSLSLLRTTSLQFLLQIN